MTLAKADAMLRGPAGQLAAGERLRLSEVLACRGVGLGRTTPVKRSTRRQNIWRHSQVETALASISVPYSSFRILRLRLKSKEADHTGRGRTYQSLFPSREPPGGRSRCIQKHIFLGVLP